MAARRPFWKWHRWKSIGFCLWPPSTCIWNLKLKFQSKLDLCSGNHVVYRQTDGRTDRRTDKVNPVYILGGGIKIGILTKVVYTFGPNLVILAWTGDELSCGQASAYRTHRRTDGRTHRQTDAGNDNTRRPKLAWGKNVIVTMNMQINNQYAI